MESQIITLDQIYTTTAKDLLNRLAAEGIKVPLIIIDPPFNTTGLSWDKELINFDDLAQDLLKVMPVNGWLFLFGTIEMAATFLKYYKLKFTYIWEKPNIAPASNGVIRPRLITEFIFALNKTELTRPSTLAFNPKELTTVGHKCYIKKGYKNSEFTKAQGFFGNNKLISRGDNTRKGTNLIKFPSKPYMKLNERTEHPTQKPIDLLKLLIRGYSNPDDLVLDCFAGSGTTLVAAKELGRRYIGSEINPKYVKICEDRLNNTGLYQESIVPHKPKNIERTKANSEGQLSLF